MSKRKKQETREQEGGIAHVSKYKGRWWCRWCWRPLNECVERMVGGHCRERDAALHRASQPCYRSRKTV